MALKPIPADKANHFIIGQGVFALFFFLSYHPSHGVLLNAAMGIGMLACTLFGLGKEVWDKRTGKGTAESLDCLSTMAGGISLCGMLLLFTKV